MLSARRSVVACVRVGARVLMLSARGNVVRVGVLVFASVYAANIEFHTVTQTETNSGMRMCDVEGRQPHGVRQAYSQKMQVRKYE